MELWELTIKQAIKGLREKKFSSEELVGACLKRIKELNPKLNAFITIKQKAKSKKQNYKSKFKNRALEGIPFGVKDNFCTIGIRTTAGSNVLRDYVPPYDATVVRRLKDAGAVIIGKTNMDAWAHGSSTETSDFGTTRNPWNLNHSPGGSSGGSTAAIAADLTIGAIGSETAGSIRQPAAWCGVVGFKPTYGRISRYGLISMASSLDCPGPITKTVRDAEIIFQILAGKDAYDATSINKSHKSHKSHKIGIPKEYFVEGIDREVQDKVWEAIKVLEKQGNQIKQVSLIDPKYSIAVYTILQRSEVSSNLARYDGIRYGFGRDKFGDEAKRRIMFGTYTLSAGYYEAYYLKAQKVRTLITRDFERVFKEIDCLVAPTSPTPALKIGESEKDPMFGERQDVLVEPSTLAGLPGLSLPCGFTKSGLPIGMQIMGPMGSEELLFTLGKRYQEVTDWHKRRPKI